MSCLLYDRVTDLSAWLHEHGIFNAFIHKSTSDIVNNLEQHNIDYSLSLDNTITIVAGMPMFTTFTVYKDHVTSTVLGELHSTVNAWDVYTEQASMDAFLTNHFSNCD